MAVPNYDHIVVVVMENHDYSQIIGNSQAPYINGLAAGGALLTNYDAITHPSEPNYFALYAGSTFGISDDNHYSEPDPTLATILQGAGKTFTGYVEGGDTSYDHNPWESFPEGTSVEKDFSTFPSSSNFSSLPNVSFVIPNVDDDMHNGTIQQGDTWLQSNISSYAQWAQSHNSLLVVTWDENDGTDDGNHVATILYGAHVAPGTTSGTAYNHYDLLSMLATADGVTGPRNAATAAPIDVFSNAGGNLAGTVQLTAATEATALPATTTIADFTDSNTADTAAGFTATINWGDGTSSAGAVSGSNGTFTVDGGHSYADEGNDALSVAITRTSDNSTITPTGTVAVAEGDTLTPHSTTITATAGQALSNIAVASFTDNDTANGADDFAASIDWGDGTTSAGTVAGGNGTFTVSGSHTYANPGTDPVAVTLSDDAPGSATATANSTAQVSGGSGALAGQVTLKAATEATALPAGTQVATFTDTNTADAASGFGATITWGDGTTSAGTVSGSNGSFTVSGGHTYADEGNDSLSVAITRTSDNTTITPSGAVAVAEGDTLTPHGTTITGTAGQALSNVAVASFTDSDTANLAGDFTAGIDWGDGSTSAGTVAGSNGTFTVSGSHTYANPGTDPVAVTLSDDAPGTATATANSTAQVGAGAGSLSGQVALTSATEGAALPASTTIASFTDTNTADTAAGFTATVNWGDGTTSAGIVSGSNGNFSVDAGHTYADEGNDALSVTITRISDKSTIAPSATVAVAEGDTLTPHATTIAATAGQALSNVAVASFTDSDATNVAGDFNASIEWGDGSTSPGTVAGGNGTFTVSGSHTYANPGTDAVAVTLADDAPSTVSATANSTAQVGGGGTGPLSGKITLSTTTEGTALPTSTAIASFSDTNTHDRASGFKATVNWGDGTSSPGVVKGSKGSFTVDAGHTYADEGNDTLSVTITRTSDNTTIAPSGAVLVTEGDTLTPHSATIIGTAGQALSNVTVGTFTDSDAANTAADFTVSIDWGDGSKGTGTVSGANGTFTVTGSHTYANAGTDPIVVTLADDPPGTATATANSTAQIGAGGGNSGGGGGRTIDSSIAGPVNLVATDNPLTITGSGTVASTGSGVAGVNGPTNTPATITNAGHVTSTGGAGVYLTDSGTVTNAAGGSIAGLTTGVYGGYGYGGHRTASSVTNAGSINATGSNGAGVFLAGGGDIANQSTGSISGGYIGITILGGGGQVTNAGTISNGIYLAHGGSMTNSAGASTSGNNFGVFVGVGPGTVTNDGSISSTNNNGVYLQAGGVVTNGAGASIAGPGFGVAVYGSAGTVTNNGTISGSSRAVVFGNTSGSDRVVVGPSAVFHGSVNGGSGTNTLELAGGTGSITGLSGGSGTVSENGTWSFTQFGNLAVDAGGDWTLSGSNVATLTNDGTIGISGSLSVSSIDPASTGVFLLNNAATFDVASALGSQTAMQFQGSSKLTIDNAGSFGTQIGNPSAYAGPMLEDFTAGDMIDLKNFGSAGVTLAPPTAAGVLQIANGGGQVADLAFQTSSLGSGVFHAASDGGTGIIITHS